MLRSGLNSVKWLDFPSNHDSRGVLTSIEGSDKGGKGPPFEGDVPFEIKRIFYLHHIISDRGGHAHQDTDQIVIAAAGQFKMALSDGDQHQTYQLNDPTKGVYTPRLVFITLYDVSPDAVCLVLANTHYDMSKSIRSWEDYVKIIGRIKD